MALHPAAASGRRRTHRGVACQGTAGGRRDREFEGRANQARRAAGTFIFGEDFFCGYFRDRNAGKWNPSLHTAERDRVAALQHWRLHRPKITSSGRASTSWVVGKFGAQTNAAWGGAGEDGATAAGAPGVWFGFPGSGGSWSERAGTPPPITPARRCLLGAGLLC